MFARLADGGDTPTRTLYGQPSRLSRTMHDIRYNADDDEIVVPVPYSHAILTFAGDANGQEEPIRAIQGPQTGEIGSRLDIDVIHNEIVTYADDTIKIFPLGADGDVASLRVIEGPDTMLRNTYGIAVDPVNDVIIIGINRYQRDTVNGGILIFDRTASGNVPPVGVIQGPKSEIIRINQIQTYPERDLIVAAMPGIINQMEPEQAFVGVWSIHDNGDIPPLYKIPIGETTGMKKPFGVVLNRAEREVIVSDMRNQGVLVFDAPEIF